MNASLIVAYTVEEAAASGAGGRTKLFKDIRAGKLRAKKNGRRTLILPEDLQAYVSALPDARSVKAA